MSLQHCRDEGSVDIADLGGGGPHFCLGAHLARREIRVMFHGIRLSPLALGTRGGPRHYVEVYGRPARPHVVVELTPELSGEIVDETTTVSLPVDAVRLVTVAA